MTKKVIFLFVFLFLKLIFIADAAVDVKEATVTGICSKSGIFKPLGNIIINENLPNDFGLLIAPFTSTFQFSAPSNIEFKPNTGSISFSGGELSGAIISVTGTRIYVSIAGINLPSWVVGHGIDGITISGVQVVSESNSFSNQIIEVSNVGGTMISGLPNGTDLAYINSVLAGNILGWENNYCKNGNTDTVEFFPTAGSFSFSFPNGTTSGSVLSITGNKLYLSPQFINTSTSIGVSFTYTFPTINGCNQMYREAIVHNTFSGINFIPSNNDFTYPYTSATGVSMLGIPIGGVFSGEGVSGNQFIPNAIGGPYPKNIPVTYTNIAPNSGCKSSITKDFTVYNPLKAFDFTPTPPLEVENATLTGWFCVNDYNQYKIALNTLTGISLPEVSLSSVSGRSVSITHENYPSSLTLVGDDFGKSYGVSFVGSTFGNINDFRFVPSLSTIIGQNVYYLNYNADIITLSGRSQPFLYRTESRQQITIAASTDTLSLASAKTQSICFGTVEPSHVVSITNTISGSYFRWYMVTGSGVNQRFLVTTTTNTTINITSLGINSSTPVGQYNFSVSQKKYEGCESNAISFNINIKAIPTVPGLSNVENSFPSFCEDTTYKIVLYPNITTSGYSYLWHDEIVTSPGQSAFSTTAISDSITVVSSSGYYLTTMLDGCESNQLISTLSGSNPTIAYIGITFNQRPAIPTVVGTNLYCQGNTLQALTVTGVYTTPSSFRWYTSTVLGSIITTSLGITNNVGFNYTNYFNHGLNSTNAFSTTYFVKSVITSTGCKSLNFLPVNISVFNNPSAPDVYFDNLSGFIPGRILNNRPYCYDESNTSLIGVYLNSFESNPTFTWYNGNTISGITTTLTSIVTGSSRNVPNIQNLYITQTVNNCVSPFKSIDIIVNQAVSSPTITSGGFNCTGNTMSDLVAISTISGGIIRWYSSVSGILQSVSISGFSPSSFNPVTTNLFSNSITGSYIIGADVIDNLGCVSSITSNLVEYRQTPSIPIVFDTVYCAGSFLPSLVKANTDLISLPTQFMEWNYPKLNITINGINSTIAGNLLESRISASFLGNNFTKDTTYFLNVRNHLNGCFGAFTSLGVYFRTIPSPPATNNYSKNICFSDTLPTIVSNPTGQNITKWYISTPSINSVPLSTIQGFTTANVITTNSAPSWTSNSVNAPSPDTYLFYHTQTNNVGLNVNNFTFSGCESEAKVDTVYYYPLPPVPNVTSITSICLSQNLVPVTVSGGINTLSGFNTGSTFEWFSTDISTNILSTNNTFFPPLTVNNDTTTTYWVSQRNYINGSFSCQSPRTSTIYQIKDLPVVDIQSTKSNYSFCNFGSVETLTGVPSGGIFITTFIGLTTLSGSKAALNPSITFAGNQLNSTVRYSYTSISGCSNSVSKDIQINIKPSGLSLTFSDGSHTATGFCATPNSTKDILLSTSLPTSILGIDSIKVLDRNKNFIQNINNRKFNPSSIINQPLVKLPNEDQALVYLMYKFSINGSGCYDSILIDKYLYSYPNIDFKEDANCEKTLVNIFSTITGINSISGLNYKWTGTSISSQNTTSTSLVNSFTPGPKNITFSVTTNDGCKNNLTKVVRIGAIPEAKFLFKNICEGEQTLFSDSSKIANGKIVSRILDFGDNSPNDIAINSILGVNNISISGHHYATNLVTEFISTMTITSDLGCASTVSSKINILPKFILTSTGGYFDDFNSGNGGWFTQSLNGKENLNTWTWGTPVKKYMDGSFGGASWFTADDPNITNAYSTGQSSVINSPCFDFSNYSKPMVTFDLYNDTRDGADGAIFQYSKDGGTTWNQLGIFESGINWYNTLNILANPGNVSGNTVGWSSSIDTTLSNASHWIDTRHSLDSLRNQPSVRFRIAFASSNQGFGGVAFGGIGIDNFRLGQRTKVALIEQFVNESSVESKIVSRGNQSIGLVGIDNIVKASPDNVVAIKYHTSFPSDDRFNLQNPSDPGVRVVYYGVSSAPYTLLDGNVFAGSTYSTQDHILEDSLNKIAQLQTLNIPDFDIYLNNSSIGGILNITLLSRINYVPTNDTILVLYVAQIERSVTFTGFNGQPEFESVLRKLIPDAAGTRINSSMSINTSTVLGFNYDTSPISNLDMLGFVVFLQNSVTKEVVQAAYIGPEVTRSVDLKEIDVLNNQILVYPIPASNEVIIKVNSSEIIDLTVIDIVGNKFMLPIQKTDDQSYKINTSSLADGLYYFSFVKLNGQQIGKKVLIKR